MVLNIGVGLVMAFLYALCSQINKRNIDYGLTKWNFAFWNETSLIIVGLPLLFLEPIRFEFGQNVIIAFALLIPIRLVNMLLIPMMFSKKATPYQIDAFVPIGTLMVVFLNTSIFGEPFSFDYIIASVLLMMGTMIVIKYDFRNKIPVKEITLKTILSVVEVITISYLLDYISIYILIYLRSVVVAFISFRKGFKADTTSIENVFKNQVLGVTGMAIYFYLAGQSPEIAYFAKSTKILFSLLLLNFFKKENNQTRPSFRLAFASVLIMSSILMINFQ